MAQQGGAQQAWLGHGLCASGEEELGDGVVLRGCRARRRERKRWGEIWVLPRGTQQA